MADPCPCGRTDDSGRSVSLADCCGRWIGGEPAPDAQALMRSRYTAHVLRDGAYLLATWHPSTRPAALNLDPDVRWTHLDVLATTGGLLLDAEGTVEFAAHYVVTVGSGERRAGTQHERSRFLREAGRWAYLDGISLS